MMILTCNATENWLLSICQFCVAYHMSFSYVYESRCFGVVELQKLDNLQADGSARCGF